MSISSACAPVDTASDCVEGVRACGGDQRFELLCEEGKWVSSDCEAGDRCVDERCAPYTCKKGEKSCHGSQQLSCVDGRFANPKPCPEALTCDEGLCLPVLCQPELRRCAGGGMVEICNAQGTRWIDWSQCDPGQACVDGSCLSTGCEEGELQCGNGSTVYVCDERQRWKASSCEDDKPCFFGKCIACMADDNCGEGERCDDGECVESVLEWETQSLPSGTVGVLYSTTLLVRGGAKPVGFETVGGELPPGLKLSALGIISGKPTESGHFEVEVLATDNLERSAQITLEIRVMPQGDLQIMTSSLKDAEVDYAYSMQLDAAGGTPPLAWQVLQDLPPGLELSSSGKIHGTPSEVGDFPVELRVLDTNTPPLYAARELMLKVKIGPLKIDADSTLNVPGISIYDLPMLVQVVPYSQQLKARGGLRPHKWSEIPPPSFGGSFVSKWGLPDGLTLSESGKISGSVLDLSDAAELTIPFTNISFKGYFINVKVEDSQPKPASDTAIFFIPTVGF